ncbi:histidine phosphatase family protein [Microbacterium sp. MPKO10]|uniref:histidine phosphatase family protein n=1 Tax=Microbacterium sp. MPKO10 TaxID=2989818 RepID=UPI00223564FE|nr:histidine phosphatase family protein [Microbacterium sp. MPKO10]MCW4459173.1 histidine phosphatase family protein [Microbacterium sp. MPKO10]
MAVRHLFIARHGAADAFGELTGAGRRQAELLGSRLARVPVDAIWHSPLPRAADTALTVARHIPSAPVAEAPELIDHVPWVPPADAMPAAMRGFVDGIDTAEADADHRTAVSLVKRFCSTPEAGADTHEVLITHDYPIAWLLCHALDAPPGRWFGISSANTALTVLQFRPAHPPTVVMFNDMSHLPDDLRWTGFPLATRP